MAKRCYPRDPCEWMSEAIRTSKGTGEQAIRIEGRVTEPYRITEFFVVVSENAVKIVACPACGHSPNSAADDRRDSVAPGGVTLSPAMPGYTAHPRTLVDINPQDIYGRSSG